jgi:hypothetical protein
MNLIDLMKYGVFYNKELTTLDSTFSTSLSW